MRFALDGATVVCMDEARTVYDRGTVVVADGKFEYVGPGSAGALSSCQEVRNVEGKLLVPGLVNCHTHLTNGIHRGVYDDAPLSEWIPTAQWDVVRACNRERCYAGARLAIAENLLNGVTTVISGEMSVPDTAAIDGVLDAVQESRIRAVVARVSMDSAEAADPSQSVDADVREDVSAALQEVERLRARYNGDRIEVIPEPLGVLRCTSEMVRDMSSFARGEGIRMTMHVASSPDEMKESMRRYDVSPIRRLADLDALGPHLMIAHCVCASADDVKLLAENGVGVSHNPVANLMYAAGTAPLAELLEAGVAVGLGTDGASTNNGQNMWEAMKFSVFLQKARLGAQWGSGELALELATIGGASASGLATSVGSIEVGKEADFIIIDPKIPQLTPRLTWPSNLVYSNEHNAVIDVFVGGDQLVESGSLTYASLDELCDDGNRAATEVDSETGLYSRYHERSKWRWVRRRETAG